MHAQPRRESRRHGARDMRALAPHAAAARAREHVRMLRWLFNLLPVHKNCQLSVTATSQVLRPHIPAQSGCPPLPVPVLAPQASTPSACVHVCVRQGRAHRLRARDRAAPSERDGAIVHGNYASVTLRTALVRRRPAARSQPEGPTVARGRRATRRCARVGDRHAVEHELALAHDNRPAVRLHARGCRALGRVI